MRSILRIPLVQVLFLSLMICWLPVTAQQPVSKKEAKSLLCRVDSVQTEWERVELNGKLRMEGLPLSPSLKVYMENGIRLDISIRAPFVGEVGRIQATSDSVVAVNKMKKVYWSASMDEVVKEYPGGLEMLQNILLGRMTFFGEGPLGSELQRLLDIYPDDEGGWLVMPRARYQPDGARYGYVVDNDGFPAALIIERDDTEDFLQIDYGWKRNKRESAPRGHTLDILVSASGKDIEAMMEFDAPKWDCKPMQLMETDRKYRRVSIKEFIKKLI